MYNRRMVVALGADHAGFELKEALKRGLDARGVAWRDFGTTGAASVDYPDYAVRVAEAVAAGQADRGILVCGSGVGMAIAANKVPGIRASVITDEDWDIIQTYLVKHYGRVNVNRARPDDLAEVLGVTPETAAAIVAYRKEHGEFVDFDAFAKVPGLDLAKLEKLRDAISF